MPESGEEMAAVAADARAKIAKYGYVVVAVFGSETTVPFAYTVGLTELGEPELMLVARIHPSQAKVVLDNLARRVVEDGARFRPGDVPPDVLHDGYEAMICGPIPAVTVEDYPPGLAGMLYGKQAVRVYQVVCQDRNHLSPWQDGYDMPSQLYLRGGRG